MKDRGNKASPLMVLAATALLFASLPGPAACQTMVVADHRASAAPSPSAPSVDPFQVVPRQGPARLGPLSQAQGLAIGLGVVVGTLGGLALSAVTAPDDCGFECLMRPLPYMLGGATVGLGAGIVVAIVLEVREDRLSLRWQVPLPR